MRRALAPLVLLTPMSLNNHSMVWAVPLGLDVSIALGGAALGVVVGLALWGAARLLQERPLWLTPVGFPIGALAGLSVGAFAGSFLHPQAIPVVGGLGMVTGGLVLGLAWLPYLALKLAGRSGLPLVVLAALGSPLAGAMALLGFFWLGI